MIVSCGVRIVVVVHVRDLFDLTGKSAIVTGGGSGLGRQMAQPQVQSIVKFLTSLNGELSEELKNGGGG